MERGIFWRFLELIWLSTFTLTVGSVLKTILTFLTFDFFEFYIVLTFDNFKN